MDIQTNYKKIEIEENLSTLNPSPGLMLCSLVAYNTTA